MSAAEPVVAPMHSPSASARLALLLPVVGVWWGVGRCVWKTRCTRTLAVCRLFKRVAQRAAGELYKFKLPRSAAIQPSATVGLVGRLGRYAWVVAVGW